MMLLFAQVQPVPHDIPLPLPMQEWILVVLLIISFLAHLLFVNLMVGGTFAALVSQILGLKDKRYDKLAKEIASTVTVNKSLAVVIGVAPLLIINTLYTVYFYSANALTGTAFISIIPLVAAAFLLLYYHKYNWDKFENRKKLHISILGAAFIIFLFIPLVFAANINLMQFPERWGDVAGFISSIFVYNVIPRYLHFVTGMIAVTGLFLTWYFGRKNYPFEERLPGFSRDEIKRKGFKFTFYFTLSQLVWGPLLFFTFPWRGITWELAFIIIGGVILAGAAMILIWNETKRDHPGKFLAVIILLLTLTVGLMGWGRHTYRENVISPHKEMMMKKK